jgi:Fe-S-cluster-containing dehydrogenase component
VGCHACVVACMNENGFQTNNQWRNIHKSNSNHYPDLPLFYLSLACNHCDDAPCLKNCPAQAYSRNEKTGAIIHHPEKCIGCKYCTWACPYDAPKYNHDIGIIEKCTFCNHRIEEDLKPACANLCPTGALDFSQTEFSKEEAFESSPVPVKIGSSLKIEKLRNKIGPEIDQQLFIDQDRNYIKQFKETKISAKKEWPLVIFTMICAFIVGIFTTDIKETFDSTYQLMFIGLIISGAVLSAVHLGKKIRIWRSILNIRNSWLSREILFFGLFFAGVISDLYVTPIPDLYFYVVGALLLLSVDMLYKLATWKWPINIHSANTLLIGLTIYLLTTSNELLFIFLLSFRITLYAYRKFVYHTNYLIGTSRILLAITAVALFDYFGISLILLLLSDLIDRIEFYNELSLPEITKP